jgi:hypothetical protein
MSEDLNQAPGEPEESEQPPVEAGSSQGIAPEPPLTPPLVERQQPVSESILPEQPASAQPQYPPSPDFYAQMPVADPYRTPVPPAQPPAQGMPGFPPVQGAPGFPPPSAYGYGFPSAQGAPGFPPPSAYGQGFPPPQAQPLPLGQAIRELPRQYKKILFKPGVRSFGEEQGKADWGIIWVQLLFWMILQVVVSIPLFLAYDQALASNPSLASTGADASLFTSPAVLLAQIVLEAVLAPLIFLAGVGIQYLVARAFKGTGSFKQQTYNQLLFQIPLGLITGALALVLSTFIGRVFADILNASAAGYATAPLLSGPYLLVLSLFDLVSLAVGIYTTILTVFSFMAVHRMSGGRATASVLIPYGVLILLTMLCVCAAVVVVVASSGSTIH